MIYFSYAQAYLAAQKIKKTSQARFPVQNENSRWPQRPQTPPISRSEEARAIAVMLHDGYIPVEMRYDA